MDSMKTAFTALQKRVVRLETSVVGVKYATSVKVPFCDGSTSWTAYWQQFQTVAASNGWMEEQCLSALTVALRGQVLTVLEALPDSGSRYKQLLEALKS
ncbi:unnamed protein product [Arctia plantaginis]|uniref:Uncharacterized protein n=1 Tax=Arctia plantaginis TaxID=874455 RepID=A0A8S0Z206_ARCPL|nr:unnamed protein product [Arctia plantaginis]